MTESKRYKLLVSDSSYTDSSGIGFKKEIDIIARFLYINNGAYIFSDSAKAVINDYPSVGEIIAAYPINFTIIQSVETL